MQKEPCEIYEEWRDIPGFEGKYRVSSAGRVKSLKREGGFGVHSRDKIISQEKIWTGYLRVTLSKKRVYAHRVVALAFIENPNNLPSVNHKDGNKENNCVSNLEWVSRRDNTLHAYRTGLLSKMYGEKNPQAKLSDEDRDKLLSEIHLRTKYLANKYRISESRISGLKKKLKEGQQRD